MMNFLVANLRLFKPLVCFFLMMEIFLEHNILFLYGALENHNHSNKLLLICITQLKVQLLINRSFDLDVSTMLVAHFPYSVWIAMHTKN